MVGHIVGHDAAGADDGIVPDDHLREDRGPGPDRRPLLHQRGLDRPVRFGLEFPRRSRRPRIGVVDEDNTVADEDVVLDRHALTDEGVTRNLAPLADLRILLDLDKRADLRVVAELVAVPVDELRATDTAPYIDPGHSHAILG